MNRSRSRITQVLFGLAFLFVLVPLSSAGTYYRTVMTRRSGTATVDAWTDGQGVRFESVQSDDSTLPVGFRIIADELGIKVSSASGKCFQMTREQYAELKRKRFDIKLVGPVKLEKVLQEDGGVILGNRTTHYRMRISATLQVGDGGEPTLYVVDEDFWAAPSVPEAPRLLNMMFTQTLGVEEVDKALEFPEIKGFKFKRTVVITTNGEYAGQSVVEVKEFRDQSIAPSVFKLDMPCSPVPSKAP